METVGATFTDHGEVRRTLGELSAAGMGDAIVIPLADVDPPLADPVLVAVRVEEGQLDAARLLLHQHGGALMPGDLP